MRTAETLAPALLHSGIPCVLKGIAAKLTLKLIPESGNYYRAFTSLARPWFQQAILFQ